MLKVTVKTGNSCWLLHSWELIKTDGDLEYKECSKCGSRMAHTDSSELNPVDIDWLKAAGDENA